MIAEKKRQLRNKYREIRGSLENTYELSSEICTRVIESDFYKNADIVLVYFPIDSEVDTRSIIDKALCDNKRVALPKCSDRNGNMSFYYISSPEDLNEGMYSIMEPCCKNEADVFSDDSLCILPALSFDKDGFRLGYGKGYYDRFLDKFIGVTVGVCYDACISDSLPRDQFDKKVNYLITNTKIYDLR